MNPQTTQPARHAGALSLIALGLALAVPGSVTAAPASAVAAEIDALRRCAERGRPYGSGPWIEQTAKQLGLQFTLRSRGRPQNKSHR